MTGSSHSGAMAGGDVHSPVRLEGNGEMAFPVEAKSLTSQPVGAPGAGFALSGRFVRSCLLYLCWACVLGMQNDIHWPQSCFLQSITKYTGLQTNRRVYDQCFPRDIPRPPADSYGQRIRRAQNVRRLSGVEQDRGQQAGEKASVGNTLSGSHSAWESGASAATASFSPASCCISGKSGGRREEPIGARSCCIRKLEPPLLTVQKVLSLGTCKR